MVVEDTRSDEYPFRKRSASCEIASLPHFTDTRLRRVRWVFTSDSIIIVAMRSSYPAACTVSSTLLISLHRDVGMSVITTSWTWLRLQIRDHRSQLRLCLRVTAAALLSFVLGKSLNIPLGGLWAVLTAVVVTQMSVGGSLKATIEYLTGTLGGAVYAGAIAALIPPTDEISLLIALAIAVAPLALLAAINPSFRVGPFTAVIVVVGSSVTHSGPVDSAVLRVLEVAIGGVIGLAVSVFVFPARAHILAIEAAASMLDFMAGVLPELLMGFTQRIDETVILRRQNSIGQAFMRTATIAAEAGRERMAYLASEPDTGPLLRTLLRLRHDFVMIGRAAVVPFSETFQARLKLPLASASETAADYLRGCSAALIARHNPPPLDAVDAAFDGYEEQIATLRREGLTRDLPVDVVERFFAASFALELLHRDLGDLEECATEYAGSTVDMDHERTN
jgi:uncharacterized membrane protein YccC